MEGGGVGGGHNRFDIFTAPQKPEPYIYNRSFFIIHTCLMSVYVYASIPIYFYRSLKHFGILSF